jgi:Zn-dependent protease with chaperone function
MNKYKVSLKEKVYFSLMMAIGLAAYFFIGSFLYLFEYDAETRMIAYIYGAYLGLFVFYALFVPLIFKGSLIGNAIKITDNQFPEYAAIIKKQSALLNLKKVPESYIIQSGGVLNAFATRVYGRNYVVLYSALLSKASNESQEAVEFIIAHELGHIKRNHVSFLFQLIMFPASLIPFLYKAYSRAREYTCDSIGKSLAPLGAEKGLIILSAGKDLAEYVNVDQLIATYNEERCFSSWLFEILSTHPLTIKRIQALRKA